MVLERSYFTNRPHRIGEKAKSVPYRMVYMVLERGYFTNRPHKIRENVKLVPCSLLKGGMLL